MRSIWVTLALLMALLTSCADPARTIQPIEEDASSPPLTKQTPEPQAEKNQLSKHRCYAVFVDDDLALCENLSILVTPLDDRPLDAEKLFLAFDRTFSKILAESGGIEMKQACEPSFPERPILASCTSTTEIVGDEARKSHVTKASLMEQWMFYSYAMVGESDGEMRSCLKRGGSWNEIDRNSIEWLDAKSRHSTKQLLKSLKRSTP